MKTNLIECRECFDTYPCAVEYETGPSGRLELGTCRLCGQAELDDQRSAEEAEREPDEDQDEED